MANNQTEVRDELLARVKAAWDVNAGGAPLFYDNMDEGRPDTLTKYGRAVVRHDEGTRSTLGPNGRFRRSGTLYVQIFVAQGTGVIEIQTLSDAIAHDLEGVPPAFGVRIRDVAINELGSDGTYFQVNVAADFTYDRQS